MKLISTIFFNLILINAAINTENGYCVSKDSCEATKNTSSDKKWLFYDVNPPEGFNLRRDVYMRFAILLSNEQKQGKLKEFGLVLPPWYKLYHWKTTKKREPIPWGIFFDIESLKSFAPVVELYEIFEKSLQKQLIIDTIYVLQNYDNPFENGLFEDKWEVQEECPYVPQYWGYGNITANEIICVKFQGKISMLPELFQLHRNDKFIMVAHGEIPLHDNYGDRKYWKCRKSMKFNKKLTEIAFNYIKEKLNCDTELCKNYLGVHWRRQDFAKYRSKDVPTTSGTVKQIQNIMQNKLPHVQTVFIATDASAKEREILQNNLETLGYNVHYYVPNIAEVTEFDDGTIAILEQIICSHAAFFVGTHESTFTFRIQEERELLGFPSDTTFNRLCPDKGNCEKPSRWTVVN